MITIQYESSAVSVQNRMNGKVKSVSLFSASDIKEHRIEFFSSQK